MRTRLRALVLAVLFAMCVFADGSYILLRRTAEPFDVTLFSDRSNLTVGQSNLSVLVQKTADHSDVPDAHVMLRFQKHEGDKITELVAPATHAKASNKLLYGATVTFPSEGDWKFTADINEQSMQVSVPSSFNVGPAEPPAKQKWLLIVFVPVAIVLFILNRRLRRRWRPSTYPPARP